MSQHICFISPAIYRYLNQEKGKAAGGAERQQYLIATELKKRDYNVSMIVGDYGQPEREEIEGIQVWKGCPRNINNLLSLTKQAIQLLQTIWKVDADIYYVRGAPRLFSAVSIFCTILNEPLIFCVANESDVDQEYLKERYHWLQNRLYQWGINQADQIITQTEEEQNMLISHFSKHSVIIPNSYNLPSTADILDHNNREFVLWVGRSNEEKKKPMRFLELAKKLSDIQFVIVAQPSKDGSHHKEVKQRAESIDNLKFVDTVAPDKIHGYYNRATLLVNTSDYEGFPNTFLEAWRYETPVVSLYYSPSDLFNKNNVGIHSGSMNQLLENVADLNGDTQRRREMGKNAREYMESNHLLAEVVDDYEELIRNLTSFSSNI